MPTSEPGQTTSEFKVIIGGFVANVIALLVAFGFKLTSEQQAAIVAFVASVSGLVGAYALSRGIRKSGTTG